MAQLPAAFNAQEHENDAESISFDPIPADSYVAQIVESDYLPTNKSNGHYLKLKYEVQGGQYSGRFVWTNLNLDNPNEKTVAIANKQFSDICKACGKVSVQDTEMLHGIPMKIQVAISPASGQYAASNDIKAFEGIAGATMQTNQEQAPAQQAAASGSKAPW